MRNKNKTLFDKKQNFYLLHFIGLLKFETCQISISWEKELVYGIDENKHLFYFCLKTDPKLKHAKFTKFQNSKKS